MRDDETPTGHLTRRAHRGIAALVALTALLVGVAGCGANREQSAQPDRGSTGAGGGKPPAVEGQDKAGAGGAANNRPGEKPALPTRPDRQIVYVGTMTVQVTDIDDAAAKAAALVGPNGVVSGDERSKTSRHGTATLVLRVPPDRFASVVDGLAKLGKELDRTIQTEDVTEAVADLDSQIKSKRASLDRTRLLFSRATQISDIVTLERELAQREAELAVLEGRKRALADALSLSTITVRLVTPAAAPQPKAAPKGFFEGFAAGWRALTTVFTALLTALGAATPFLLVLGLLLLALLALLRWRPRRRSPAGPPGPSNPTPAPAPQPQG